MQKVILNNLLEDLVILLLYETGGTSGLNCEMGLVYVKLAVFDWFA